jgi:hypothetical protein
VTEQDLLVTKAPAWFSSTPIPTRLFSKESGGKLSKFYPKSYKQPKNNKVSKRKKERQKVLVKSKTTYRRGG